MLRSAATPNRTLGASESEMEHETIRGYRPVPVAPAARGVDLRGDQEPAEIAIGVRLIRD